MLNSYVKYYVAKYYAAVKKLCPRKLFNVKKQGRPILLKELDKKVQKILVAVRNRGTVININCCGKCKRVFEIQLR